MLAQELLLLGKGLKYLTYDGVAVIISNIGDGKLF